MPAGVEMPPGVTEGVARGRLPFLLLLLPICVTVTVVPPSQSSGSHFPEASEDALATPDFDGAPVPSSEPEIPAAQIPIVTLRVEGRGTDVGAADAAFAAFRPSWKSFAPPSQPGEDTHQILPSVKSISAPEGDDGLRTGSPNASVGNPPDGVSADDVGRDAAFRDASGTDKESSLQKIFVRPGSSEAVPHEREGSVASSFSHDASLYHEQNSTSAPSTVDLRRLWEALRAADQGARRWIPRSKTPLASSWASGGTTRSATLEGGSLLLLVVGMLLVFCGLMRGDVGRRPDGCPGGDFECRSGGQKGPNHEAALSLVGQYAEAETKARLPGMPLESVDQKVPRSEDETEGPSTWGDLGVGGSPLTEEMRAAIASALGIEKQPLEGSTFSLKMDAIETPALPSLEGSLLGDSHFSLGYSTGSSSDAGADPDGSVEANANNAEQTALTSIPTVLRVVAVSPRVRDGSVSLRVESLHQEGGPSPASFIMKLFVLDEKEHRADEDLEAAYDAEVANAVMTSKILMDRGASAVSKGLYLPLYVGSVGRDDLSEGVAEASTQKAQGTPEFGRSGKSVVLRRAIFFPDAVADAMQLYGFAADTASRRNIPLSNIFPVSLREHLGIRLLLTTLKLYGLGVGYGPVSPEKILVLQDGSIKISVNPLIRKGSGAAACASTKVEPSALPRTASAFLAPEQAKLVLHGSADGPQDLIASDMWSIGAVSYFLVTGDRPFLAPSEQRAVAAEGSLLFLHQQASLLDQAEADRPTPGLGGDVETQMLQHGASPQFARLVKSLLHLPVEGRPSVESVLSEVRAIVSSAGS